MTDTTQEELRYAGLLDRLREHVGFNSDGVGSTDTAHCRPASKRYDSLRLEAADAIATLKAENEALQVEVDHWYGYAVDDPGKNPPLFWKDIAQAAIAAPQPQAAPQEPVTVSKCWSCGARTFDRAAPQPQAPSATSDDVREQPTLLPTCFQNLQSAAMDPMWDAHCELSKRTAFDCLKEYKRIIHWHDEYVLAASASSEAALADARDKALEEAAKVCDGINHQYTSSGGHAAERCAAAIRALRTTSEK